MTMFFYICEFLKISPRDFFDETIQDPQEYYEFIDNIKDLSPQQLHHISEIIKDLIKSQISFAITNRKTYFYISLFKITIDIIPPPPYNGLSRYRPVQSGFPTPGLLNRR